MRKIIVMVIVLFLVTISHVFALSPGSFESNIMDGEVLNRSSFDTKHLTTVKAAVVKSHPQTDAWTHLNNDWQLYGATPISIDTSLQNASSFTYEDLVRLKADVIIVSNPCGGGHDFTSDENTALNNYLFQGHNIIGTYLFQLGSCDNRGLFLNHFGLKMTIEYTSQSISNIFDKLSPADQLFTNVPGTSWTSQGYSFTQTPLSDFQWNSGDLVGAELVAETDSYTGIVSINDEETYFGIYFSNMPEYTGGPEDMQLLYNAIVYERPVTAAVVKSHNTSATWSNLNSNWSNYGARPITIDTTLQNASSFTYTDLVNQGADKLILSNPSGGQQQYSASEISAIEQYVSEGHNIIGTYLLFQYLTYDNRGLAPFFGLRSDIDYDILTISNIFDKNNLYHPLYLNIPGLSWTSDGYNNTHAPLEDNQWNFSDLNGAEIIAESDTYTGIVSEYNGITYNGIYISNMPEYLSGTNDYQLLYNAIVYEKEVIAAVVKSYPSWTTWPVISAYWYEYGSTKVFIDYSLRDATSFTYQDLVDTGADVVILSNICGGMQQYTTEEMDAVMQYAIEGHNVIATNLAFYYPPIDNSALAPLFGLRSDIIYTYMGTSNTFSQIDTSHKLFTNITSPTWISEGYEISQLPASDSQWNLDDLNGAEMIAQSDNYAGIISIYDAGTYRGIFISNMPEYDGNDEDKQLLYNSIVYGHPFRTQPGTVPDGHTYSGTPLTVEIREPFLALDWSKPGGSCSTADYSVYRGTLPWTGYNHTQVICSTGGATTASIEKGTGDYYYIVVGQNSGSEGSYGSDSLSVQRPVSSSQCFPQEIGYCN